MINFDLTDEQKALQDTARRFATAEIAPIAGELDEKGEFQIYEGTNQIQRVVIARELLRD